MDDHLTGILLYIFDLDGTLISRYTDNPHKEYRLWHVLPNRKEMLATLRASGAKISIATNQGAVAFGFVSEGQFRAKIKRALTLLGLPEDTPVAVCFADSRSKIKKYRDPAQVARRKPAGAMISELLALHDVNPKEAIYIGDRPEDKDAASAAGVKFARAEQFFAREIMSD